MENSDYLLVDGTNLAFRGFYAVKNLSRKDGLATNAIYGFISSLWSLENVLKAENKVIFFDCGRSKSRMEILPDYKANRPPTPDEFKIQIPWIKKISELLGYHVIEREGIEADDLIGSWAKKISNEQQTCAIASSDKDLMQLVDSFVSQYVPADWKKFTQTDVFEKMGVLPTQIVDFLSLVGDSADNFNGIQGVGPKTAATWLNKYSSINCLLENSNSVKPERFQQILKNSTELITRNVKLATLQTNHFSTSDEQLYSIKKLPSANLISVLKELELNSLLKKANERITTNTLVNQQQELF